MRRKITVFLIIAVCYLLQSTVFQALSFASISPNLMIVVVSAFGFMRGKKEGLWIGFFTGLLLDVFTGCVQSDALQNRFQAGNGSVPNPVGVLSISW